MGINWGLTISHSIKIGLTTLGVYTTLIMLKALKTYIKNNS